MSFRELRSFTEQLRGLGYPRLISIENFREPNFKLVAEILYWLAQRFEPNLRISDWIETEEDRIEFVMSMVNFFWSRTGIKIYPKKLYNADGYAVKELLKISTVLYTALRNFEFDAEGNLVTSNSIVEDAGSLHEDLEDSALAEEKTSGGDGTDDIMEKLKSTSDKNGNNLFQRTQQVKLVKSLSSEITTNGASLYDMLEQEIDIQKDRTKVLKFLDSLGTKVDSNGESTYVRKYVHHMIQTTQENVELLSKQLRDTSSDEKALEIKIKKKLSELERNEKRLKNLTTIRPAFMDEYEKLEKELQKQYDIYVCKFRNIHYLENELNLYHLQEKEKLEASDRYMKKMQKKLREEELKLLRGEKDIGGGLDNDALISNFGGSSSRKKDRGNSRHRHGSNASEDSSIDNPLRTRGYRGGGKGRHSKKTSSAISSASKRGSSSISYNSLTDDDDQLSSGPASTNISDSDGVSLSDTSQTTDSGSDMVGDASDDDLSRSNGSMASNHADTDSGDDF